MSTPDSWQVQIEAQRRGIGREIHDAIGGALAAVNFDLSWLARQPARDAESTQRLASAQQALAIAMDATRNAVAQLYPPDLSDGLAPAVSRLVADFARRTGIDAGFDAPGDAGPRELPAPQQLAVYRTVQEALTNIARHAQARQVRITLRDDDADHVALEVRDDGRGFDTAIAHAQAESFGLRGLTERAHSVGGRLDVESRPGHGTTIVLVVSRQDTP